MTESRGGKRRFFGDLRVALKRYRDANSLTQDDIAALLGCTRSAVSNFEKGRHLLREEALEKLIELLRSPSSLLANELRTLAEVLDSPTYDWDAKVERFFNRVTEYRVAEESIRTAFNKARQDGE